MLFFIESSAKRIVILLRLKLNVLLFLKMVNVKKCFNVLLNYTAKTYN